MPNTDWTHPIQRSREAIRCKKVEMILQEVFRRQDREMKQASVVRRVSQLSFELDWLKFFADGFRAAVSLNRCLVAPRCQPIVGSFRERSKGSASPL